MVIEADMGGKEKKYVRLPTFLEKGFLSLKSEVIDKEICSFCGTCIALCDKIRIREGKIEPEFVDEYDTICGLCYSFCPRTFLPLAEIEERIFRKKRGEKEAMGIYKDCYRGRSKKEDIIERAQDGGAVTSLLAYALSKDIIDCAVITSKSAPDDWKPVSKVVKSYEDLKEGAGTKYNVYASVVGIKEAIKEGYKDIGFVGLPCQIQGLRKIMTSEEPYEVGKEKIRLLIGLFCMENFKEGLLDFIVRNLQLDIREVKKFDIKEYRLWIYEKEKEKDVIYIHKIPLSSLKNYVNEGCLPCTDFTAELADISIGSVGSEKGWSTVLVRTDRGEKLIEGAMEKGYIEVKKPVNIEEVRRLSENKKEKVERRK